MSTITTVQAGITGGTVIEVSGYDRITFPELQTAFEPSKLYRIRARINNTVRPTDSARNKVRIGVEGLAIDGETLVDKDGLETVEAQYFVAAEFVDMEAQTLGAWVEFTGFIRGQGTYVPNATSPGTASPVNAGVTCLIPVIWVNCTDGDGTCQIDSVFFDIMPEDADQVAESGTKKWAGETGATVGAQIGVNFKDSGGTSLADADVKNASISSAHLAGTGKAFAVLPESGATVGARAGVNLKNAAGTVLADADVVTSQGTAADTSNVSGRPAELVASSAGLNFFDSFDRPVDGRYSLQGGPPTSITYPANGQTGGKVIRIAGPALYFYNVNIPYDPTKLYKISVRARCVQKATSGINIFYAGFYHVGSDGVTITGAHWFGCQSVNFDNATLNQWYEFTGYCMGQSASASSGPSTDPAKPSVGSLGFRYIRPTFVTSWDTGNSIIEVDYFKIEIGDAGLSLQLANTDPALVADHSFAGRSGYFDVSASYTPAFGYVLGLWPIDGKMYPANLYDTSSNGFMAVDLGLGTGRQKLALPGSIIRDDSLTLITGREIFLEPRILLGHPTGGAGVITQTEPTVTQMRFVLGKALSATTWHFDPQPVQTLREETPWMARYVYTFSENLNCLIEWSGVMFAGCSNGKIYASYDYGLTWTNVYSGTGGTTANVNAFAVMGSTLYAVMDKGTDGNCKCVRTTNGTSWTASNIAAEPYCYDIMKEAASNLLMACTGNYSGSGKIFTSSDGATWTLRYTSPTESDIIRFAAYSTTYDYAIEGYATAKTLYSTAGTTWAIRNTYTGATSPTDLMGYTEPVNGLKYVCACIGDTGVIYGGTTTISTAEKTDANIWWENFIIIDGYLYAIGTVGSNYGQLWKRTVVSDGAGGWTISWVKVMDTSNLTAWRFILASNGFIYFVSLMDNSLWRISKRNHVLI